MRIQLVLLVCSVPVISKSIESAISFIKIKYPLIYPTPGNMYRPCHSGSW